MRMPVTRVTPTEGVTTKPEGLIGSGRRESKFRYLVVLPSIALATPSELGLLADDAMIASPGCSTFFCANTGAASTRASATMDRRARLLIFIESFGSLV